jgi:outer membrane protein
MRTNVLLLTTVLCLGQSPISLGEDLLQIYDMALQSDPVLREAAERRLASQETRPQALANLLPNLNAVGDYDYIDERTDNPITGVRDQTYTQNSVAGQLNQVLYNRGFWMQLKQADDVIAQADAQYKNTQIDLMVRTTEAYFNILRAADNVTVTKAELRANERQLDQSKQRFEVGLVAITDVNESQAAYDRARADVISAENALDNRWEELRKIIGNVSVPLARLGDKLPLTPPEPNDIDQWAETAARQNYGIIAAQDAAEVAQKTIEIERSGHFPRLDLVASYGISRTGSEIGSDVDRGVVGVELNLPIYTGGAVSSRTRQAGYDYQAALQVLDQTRREVNRNVKDAFRGILSSISEVKARKAALVSAQSALESTEAGLEVGTRTQVDVLNAQQRLYDEERFYLSSRYDYILNGVFLHQATSTLTRELLAKGNAWLKPTDPVPPPRY